jgi:hypothetical protein
MLRDLFEATDPASNPPTCTLYRLQQGGYDARLAIDVKIRSFTLTSIAMLALARENKLYLLRDRDG